MKLKAKESFIKALEKEDLGIDLYILTDYELKKLYTKLQHLRQGYCRYHMLKKEDFKECLYNGKLQYVSFRNTPGVRQMTFKEYLEFETFVENNPNMYKHFNKTV